MSSCFMVTIVLRQGFGLSPWLFNIYKLEVVREGYDKMHDGRVNMIDWDQRNVISESTTFYRRNGMVVE